MNQEDNKEFNAAYDLIHQNSIKIPEKIIMAVSLLGSLKLPLLNNKQ